MKPRNRRPANPIDRATLATVKQHLGQDHADVIAALPEHAGDAMIVLERAARGSKKRDRARIDLLLWLGDRTDPALGEAADEEIRRALVEGACRDRSSLLQILPFEASRRRFLPELRVLLDGEAGADEDLEWVVQALGMLRDTDAAEELIQRFGAGVDTPFVVLQALVRMRNPVALPLLEENTRHPEAHTRTHALWGLAALGRDDAIAELVALLDDPDQRTPTSFTPGQARRAAQALCDVFNWPFEWDASYIEETRARWRARGGADGDTGVEQA